MAFSNFILLTQSLALRSPNFVVDDAGQYYRTLLRTLSRMGSGALSPIFDPLAMGWVETSKSSESAIFQKNANPATRFRGLLKTRVCLASEPNPLTPSREASSSQIGHTPIPLNPER